MSTDTTTRRWEDSQSEPRCAECKHEARECVCDPPEAYGDEAFCPRCNRHHARIGAAEERCQEVSRFVIADHRRRGGEG